MKRSLIDVNPKALVLSLAALAVGCQDPAVLTKVTLDKGYAVDAVLKIETASKKVSESRVFELPASDGEEVFQFDRIATNEINLELSYNGEQNLPEGVVRSALIRAKLKLEGDKDRLDVPPVVTLDPDSIDVVVNGREKDDINCRRLFDLVPGANELTVRFTGFNSLATCEGKEVVRNSPLAIGSRDVTRPDSRVSRFFSPNLFPESMEEQMGREFAMQFNAQNAAYVLSEDHPTTQYLQRLMENIARVSDNPGIVPHVYVINADVLNAFALPGGYVYVFRGLMDAARSESELIGVLGHEWAHVTARHGTRNMSKAITMIYGGQIVGGLLEISSRRSKNDVLRAIGPIVQEATVVGAYLHVMQKGRDAEREADRLGAQYAWAIGFEPWGLAGMFEVFKQMMGDHKRTSLEKLLSSHPEHDERISSVLDLSGLFFPVKPEYLDTTEDFERARQAINAEPKTDISMSEMLGLQFAESINQMVKTKIEEEVVRRAGESTEESSDSTGDSGTAAAAE